jgi:hypothetical protein
MEYLAEIENFLKGLPNTKKDQNQRSRAAASSEINLDTSRMFGAFDTSFTRDQIEESLRSVHPFRENIPFDQQSLFVLELISKVSINADHVRKYDEAMEDIRQFAQTNIIGKGSNSTMKIMVKIWGGDKQRLYDKSHIFPNQLLKSKSIRQSLCFVESFGGKVDEIKYVPLMVGSKWCATHGLNPIELHNAGEDATGYKGYFIMDSQKSSEAKYFLAHEKLSHNLPITIIDDRNNRGFMTTLKIQDRQNNSIETNVYKEKNIYYLDTADFNIKFPTNKLFKQIHILMTALNGKDSDIMFSDSYDTFMTNLIARVGGQGVQSLIMYDYAENSSDPIVPAGEEQELDAALLALYKNEEKFNLYKSFNKTKSDIRDYGKAVIDSIFPSVSAPETSENSNQYRREFNILNGKAMLLMRMIVQNNLSEQSIIPLTNRNNVGYITFLTAAEVIKRDLTRDGGKELKDTENKSYRPGANAKQGDSNIYEALAFNNFLDVLSHLSKMIKPRSPYSTMLDVRLLNASHTGLVDPSESPATAKNGLDNTATVTVGFSSAKDPQKVQRYLLEILKKHGITEANLFQDSEISKDKKIVLEYTKKHGLFLNDILLAEEKDMKATDALKMLYKKYESFILIWKSQLPKLFNIANAMDQLNKDYLDLFIIYKNIELECYDISEQIFDPKSFGKKTSSEPEKFSDSEAKLSINSWNVFVNFKKELMDNDISYELLMGKKRDPQVQRVAFWNLIDTEKIDRNDVRDFDRKTRKLISVNSVPFATVDYYTYMDIRNTLKRDYRYMDVAIMEDIFEINTESGHKTYFTASYNILCDGGRIYRPLYNSQVIKELGLTNDKAMNEYHGKNRSFEKVLSDGVIEMVFPIEMEYFNIASDYRKIKNEKYAEIDPYCIYGVVSSCARMFNHNPANRCMHECQMKKAALTFGSTNLKNMFETTMKLLHTAQQCLVTTKTNEFFGRYSKNGINVHMGILIDMNNVEDSYVIHDRLARSIETEKTFVIDCVLNEGETPGISEQNDNRRKIFHAVDKDTGLPEINRFLDVGDVVFAKYKQEVIKQKREDGTEEETFQSVNKSQYIDEGKSGFVKKIKTIQQDKVKIYKITISIIKPAEVGDKFASGGSQKGIISLIRKYNQMPRIIEGKKKGVVVDVLFSLLSICSRATPGVVHELLLGNYAVEFGKCVDATSFTVNHERLTKINNELVARGHSPWGIEMCEDPKTGSKFAMMTGVMHIAILKHTSFDKQKASSCLNSSVDKSTHMPSRTGPSGALKIGYMDSNTLISHGASSVIHSLLCLQSDRVAVHVCADCGHLCDRYNDDAEFLSVNPRAKFCPKCNNDENSKSNIVRVIVPYAVVKIHSFLLEVGVKLSMFPQDIEEIEKN